jgi:peptidyl-tRNA hydrolase, PTH1 family
VAEENHTRLVVGLGNPGTAYEHTRHNIGFSVVKAYADKKGLIFRHAPIVSGDIAHGNIDGTKVILLLPATYMNSSGQAVKLGVDYFKIDLKNVLIVSDDVNLPFGKLRIRENGSAGGHNGLKSVEEHLGTQEYPRLRIGVGGVHPSELAEYVLAKFIPEETGELPKVIENAVSIVEQWIAGSIKKLSLPFNLEQADKEKTQE